MRQLALVAGVRAETISRWCSGASNPNIGGDSWRRFCVALEMTPAQSRELNVLFGAPLDVGGDANLTGGAS